MSWPNSKGSLQHYCEHIFTQIDRARAYVRKASYQLVCIKEQIVNMNSFLMICEVLFRVLPLFLDTGIQIWNAAEVDKLTTSCEDQFNNPTSI